MFFAIGAATAPWVTAILAARDDYAPPAQRAQTFVAMAGWKIAAASAGAALGGVVVAAGPRLPILTGGALVIIVTLAAALDRKQQPHTIPTDHQPRVATDQPA